MAYNGNGSWALSGTAADTPISLDMITDGYATFHVSGTAVVEIQVNMNLNEATGWATVATLDASDPELRIVNVWVSHGFYARPVPISGSGTLNVR